MPIDYTHQHLVTAILPTGESHAPISTGGAIAVDNTVDPPEEVTTIIAPGAVVGGGEATLPLAFRLLGPFTVAFDDATETAHGDPIAAGTVILAAWAQITDAFADSTDFYLILGFAPVSDLSNISGSAEWTVPQGAAGALGPLTIATGVTEYLAPRVTIAESRLMVGLYPTVPPSVGSLEAYFLIGVPA